MPSELDPAFDNYMPPRRRETPTEGMKRIELEMRDRPDLNPGRITTGAGRTIEGYNASIGAQGPVGGGVMVAADPITGQPVMVGGRAQAGPLSYQYNKPTFKGAPASQQIGVGGQPFDADTYFGVTAQQGAGGRSYGANVSQNGEDGGWSAYGGYNPTTKGVNVGGSYTANFSNGGRAIVGHTTAAGEPVSLEEHKGQIRHRQDSGNSRMAADYGYIDTSKPDHDGMKTDAFVGPHRDSKKVFVVNQQHPHTGKFNEHKVLLGYNDRAHALRDYVHSFADGLGHKRIQSVVEMGTHELKDWLKKDHTAPLRKAGGGPVHMADGGDPPPRTLTIRRGATPQGLAAEYTPPEEQAPIEGEHAGSPSPEAVTSTLRSVGEGISELYKTPQADESYTAAPAAPTRRDMTPAMLAARMNPEAQGANSPSFEEVGKIMADLAHDPIGLIAGLLPVIGNAYAARDTNKLRKIADQLTESGNNEAAANVKKMIPLTAAAVGMPIAGTAVTGPLVKAAEKIAARAGERAAIEGAERVAARAGEGAAERSVVEGGERAAVREGEAATERAVTGEGERATTADAEKAAVTDTEKPTTAADDVVADTDQAASILPDEHSMGVERQDRVVMDPAKVKLSKDERAIISGFKKKDQKEQINNVIRQTKARHPTSDGWAPMEAVGASFDEEGNPVIKWKEQAYGYNKAGSEVTRPVIDPATNKPMKQPQLDAEGRPVFDEDGNQVFTNRNVVKTETVEKPLKQGTPEYDKHLDGAVQNGYEQIMNVVQRAESGDEAAKVMLRQLGWYREFMRKGFDERGGAYPAFSDLLGATSPNTAVDQNYRYAREAQQRFGRGDFDPQVQFAKDYQGSMADFPPEQLIRRQVVDPKTGEYKQYGMNSRNAQMAMADRWREKTVGQAPKARNFSGNLGGATEAATIDVWAARHLNRMMGRDRLPPTVEKGVQGKLGSDLVPGGEFGFGQDYFQRLSDRLNQSNELKPYLEQLGYQNVTPMDLQALAWFLEKEHWTKNNWTTKSGEGGSFEQELAKDPSNRWQAGFSITQDKAPLDSEMAQARQSVENTVKSDPDVMVSRVHPTYGQYGGEGERSFDAELTAKPGWDPVKWMSEIISQAKKNNQKDVFFAKRRDPITAMDNPNARPGVEIYFQDATQMNDIIPILQQFTQRGQDGFTFTTGLRHQERISGGSDVPKQGFVPDYVGVRLQYVPEIQMRFDDDFRRAVLKDPNVLQQAMQDSSKNMMQAINAIAKNPNGAKIVDARMHHYDTVVIGKESYDQFLNGLANPNQSASTYAANAAAVDPRQRLGQPIQSHVEGRDRALGRGSQERPENASGAVERSDGQVGGFAQGGAVKGYAKGGAVPLTHYSRSPNLTEVDPAYYGTNNPGEDVARTVGRPDGNPRRSYFYLGHPGDVMPEHGVGEHAYTTSSDKLYDLSKDPLKVHRGTSPRDLNRMEQVIRAHGYEGILGENAAHPTAVLFEKKPVQLHKMTRSDAAYDASDRLAKQATNDFQDFHMRKGGDVRKSAFVLKNMKGADLDPQSAYELAGYLAGGNVDAVRSAIMSHHGFARGMSKMFHKRSHKVK